MTNDQIETIAWVIAGFFIAYWVTKSWRVLLRDYFAAKAMQGLIASNDEGAGDRIDEVPMYAYLIADAMLKARKQ
jgi:hypothetical protein